MRRETTSELALLLAVLLWGLNFSVVKVGVGQVQPLAYSVLRFSGGALAMLAFLRWREGSLGIRRADLPLFVLTAFFGITLNQLCFVYAEATTTAANVALLLATAPILTAFLVALSGQERLGRRQWAGVAVGMAGAALVIEGGSGGGGTGSLLGDLLAMGTAATWSAYSVLVRPLLQRYSAVRVSTYMMVIGVLFLAPISLPSLLGQDVTRIPATAWTAIAYSTVGAVIVTNILYFTAIRRVGTARANLFLYLEAFSGVLFAALLLGEAIAAAQLLGGLVVTAGVIVGRGGRRPEPAAAPVGPAEELEAPTEPLV